MPTFSSSSSPVLAPAALAGSARLPETALWPTAWRRPAFRWQLALVLALIFVGFVPIVPSFFRFIQQRAGHLLPDPLLALLPRADVSTPLFAIMYGGSVLTLLYLSRRPVLLLRGLWAYLFLQLMRMLVLWAVPLEPPLTMLSLHDPFLAFVFHSTAVPITKDLFFSGHTSVTTLLLLAGRGRLWRLVFGLAVLAVGVLVLVLRIHYSYDVLAAPFFAWAAYWLAGIVTKNQ